MVVKKRRQEIQFGPLRDSKVGDPPFTIIASATSGLPVHLSVESGPAQIRNQEVTLTGAGRVEIKAAQAGDETHSAAEARCSFSVGKGQQTIDFEPIPGAISVGQDWTLQARASSGLPVTFSIVAGNVVLVGNRLTPNAAGVVTVKAMQTGSGDYEAAEAVQKLTVVKAKQRLDFKALPREIFVGSTCELEAVASSGLSDVSFSVVSGKATVSASTAYVNGCWTSGAQGDADRR